MATSPAPPFLGEKLRTHRIAAPLLAAVTLLAASPFAQAQNFLRRVIPQAEAEAAGSASVRFVGAGAFSDEQLRSAIATQLREVQESGLSPARADDSAFFLASFYRKNGYMRVEVEYQISGQTLILEVKEGQRVLIGDVRFIGNRNIPEAKLYEYLIGGTEERNSREPAQFPYTEAELSAGADRIRGLYNYEGFLDAEVDTAQTQITQGGTRANVVVRVQEKTRYVFGEIRFTGGVVFPREDMLKGLGEDYTGNFSPTKVNSMQRNLQSFYKGRGYFLADVDVEADYTKARNGRVLVTFIVKPGGLYHFDGVTQRNETKEKPRLRESFLEKRFGHLSGQVYSPEKLDETFREMLRTGLFSNLRVTPTPIEDNKLRLDLTYEEAKARELGFNIGFGSYEGFIVGFSARDRNLFGNGRPLTFTAEMSQRGLSGELLYVDPWFLDSPYSFRARLFSVARDEIGYSRNTYGARIELSRRITSRYEAGVFLEQSATTVESLGIDPLELGPTSYALSIAGITQTLDYRDNALNPGRGFVASSSLDAGFVASEIAFTRATLRLSYYLPIGKTLLAFGARGGIISPVVDQIPIDVRFFNGGGTTVRSFAERRLGPRDKSGNPLGGEIYTVFNIEYQFPLGVGGLQGAVFADAGSLKHDVQLETSYPGGEMRYALGVGLRYKLPIGPLRLDYGINPNPQRDESFGAFHFSFGFAF
ncbi:MAG TPA: outer membrane protein assembly factor BamA [Chthoniobacteraceae bacterium]|jgi:outer membrane protein assembly complex protein YaeT